MTSESGEYAAGVPIGSWYGAPLQLKSNCCCGSDLASTTIVLPTGTFFSSLPGVLSPEPVIYAAGVIISSIFELELAFGSFFSNRVRMACTSRSSSATRASVLFLCFRFCGAVYTHCLSVLAQRWQVFEVAELLGRQRTLCMRQASQARLNCCSDADTPFGPDGFMLDADTVLADVG